MEDFKDITICLHVAGMEGSITRDQLIQRILHFLVQMERGNNGCPVFTEIK